MPSPVPRPTAGYLSVAGAAVLWASSGVVGKALFAEGMPPLALVQVRVALAAAILLGVFLARNPGLLRIRSRDLPYFLILGGGAMALVQATYFYAIAKIPVAAAILLQYTAPLWVAAFAAVFLGERLTRAKGASLVLALGGAYLVVGGYGLELASLDPAGVTAGLVSGVCFAAYSLLGERAMHRYSPWTVLFYAFLFAAVSLHAFYEPFHYLRTPYSGRQWLGIGYVGVAGTLVPFGLYFVGVSHIRATRASITATLEPIAAAGFAFLTLGEALSPWQLAGGGLVIGAVILLNLGRETSDLSPAAVRAHRGRPAPSPPMDTPGAGPV